MYVSSTHRSRKYLGCEGVQELKGTCVSPCILGATAKCASSFLHGPYLMHVISSSSDDDQIICFTYGPRKDLLERLKSLEGADLILSKECQRTKSRHKMSQD